MDVDRLIYDLSFGIRLPNPTFCPHQIASLIKNCFYESPNKRPNFKEIKTSLKSAFNKLMKVANSNIVVNKKDTENERRGEYYSLGISKLSSSSDMKFRYTAIKKANRLGQEQKARLSQYEETNEVVVEIHRSESPLKYIDVETSNHSEGENHLKDNVLSISCERFPILIKEDHKLNHYYNTYPGYIPRGNNPLAKKQPTRFYPDCVTFLE